MNAIVDFVTERVGSLVSKKVGATILAEGAVAGTDLQGYPLILFIVVQAIVDIAKYHIDNR